MNWLRKLFGRAKSQSASDQEAIAISTDAPDLDDEFAEETYDDQPLRKARSEARLRAEVVPVNDWLPFIESETGLALRTPREVADRVAALVMVAFKASEQTEQSLVETIVAERGYRSHFTPDELEFINDPAPDERARVKFSWRCEAAWVLLWALRYVEQPLGLPREMCDVPFLSGTVFEEPDLAAKGLRTAGEILDEADLIYRCHWAVRQAGLDGAPPPAGLDPSVTMERHHALNWLIGYMGLEWDDVTTDT